MTVIDATIRAEPNTDGHLIIPLPLDLPRFRITIDLEDVPYEMVFHWNETISAWYMNIKSLADESIDVKGIRLAGGVNLLKPHAVPTMGALYMLDSEGKEEDCTFEGLGGRWKLYYVPTTDPTRIV